MAVQVDAWLKHAEALLASEYGLHGSVSLLPGENRNALIETDIGRRFVLKLASEERPGAVLELEHLAVEHLIASGIELRLPRTVLTTSGGNESHWRDASGSIVRGRLLAYVPGTPWCELARPGPPLLRNLGHALASIDRALAGFSHPAARRTHRWDLATASQHRSKTPLVEGASRRRLVEAMFHLWAAAAAPRLAALPSSVIYGDANDENVLVEDGRVAGLLDFGDTLLNPTVCELAIALVYAMLDRDDPLEAGAEVVAGYHALRPLEPLERELLFPLVCGRLAASVTVAAERRRIDPHNANWYVTEDRAWRLAEQLAGVDPAEAGRVLTKGTGLARASEDRGTSLAHASRDKGTGLAHATETRPRALSLSYREPIEIARGAGQYLYDRRGRPYLDLVNNVCHVGHCHPRVVEAGQRQMAVLNTNTRYLYPQLGEYAERLAATLPAPLEVCFFVNSGSEANELALRLARAHTGRRGVLVVDGAYHGNTTTLIAMSPYKFMGPGGTGRTEPWVHVVPMPDGYRGIHRGSTESAGRAYASDVAEVLAQSREPVAAFFAESLLSCGGQIPPPPGYLAAAFAGVRAAGALCVVDEVQVGFGRVGSHFWGFERQGVVPDIVVMGKPIGNGHPIGAVVTTREVAASFANGMEFFSTFGGNPVSCAIGLAVLDVIRDEALQARASILGMRLMDGLRDLARSHALIGDVRGAGLFIGVELVRDRATLAPAAAEAAELVNRMKARGVLLATDGPLHNVLKIKPPMVLNEDDVDMVVRLMNDELADLKPA